MSHDSTGNRCASNGFIMSPSRGTKGETEWSQCSRDHMAGLDLPCLEDAPAAMRPENDHNKFHIFPGQNWDGDDQCQALLLDQDARMDHNDHTRKQVGIWFGFRFFLFFIQIFFSRGQLFIQ